MVWKFERLGDLTDSHSITAYCPRCRHRATLDLIELLKLYGARAKFSAVHRALRCSKCGSKKPDWSFGHDGRPAEQARTLVSILWGAKK